ncbi:MAG TPA: DUF3553 domain-containing protein [Myxococcales bacterium]|nr:DUF3553 domain-containing protein [Myxococcales bacterium]
MRFQPGEFVRHPKRENWGLGEVLIGSNMRQVKVFFLNVGEKILALKVVRPIKVQANDADRLKLNMARERQNMARERQDLVNRHREFFKSCGIEYLGTREAGFRQPRTPDCFACKCPLDSTIQDECLGCRWILCNCGACGCGWVRPA